MNRIKQLRKEKGISQVKLAETLGVHQTAISQWETGRTNPDLDTAKKLAKGAPKDWCVNPTDSLLKLLYDEFGIENVVLK